MKQLFILASIFLLTIEATAQNVGIGTATPATILDVTSTTQGVLLPRVTTAQMNAIVSPANGLLVTNTDSLNRIFIYTGTGWSGLSFGGGGAAVDTSLLVHKAGTETIAGSKIFSNDLLVHGMSIGLGSGGYPRNIAIGLNLLLSNTTGNDIIAIGNAALNTNTIGGNHVAIGTAALYSNTIGNGNSGIGFEALYYNTTGSDNTAVGSDAGVYLQDGSTANSITDKSIFIGANTKALADNQTNQIVIGYNTIGLGSNTVVIGNDDISSTSLKGQVGINNSTPDASAQLDVSSTTKGLLLPRLTKSQRDAITSPAAGLMVYQIDNTPGLRVYNGTNWVRYTEIAD